MGDGVGKNFKSSGLADCANRNVYKEVFVRYFMTYDQDQELLNYRKALIFFEDQDIIHVSTKTKIPNTDKFIFYNGRILEKPTDKYFIIHDRVEGRKKVFYFDIRKPIAPINLEVEE